MKVIVLFLSFSFVFTSLISVAQTNSSQAGCATGNAFKTITFNDVKFGLSTSGTFFMNKNTNSAAYNIPANSSTSTIFASGIWFGGKNLSGQLKLAAQTFGTTGTDFWPGPLQESTGSTTEDICSLFNQIYTVKKSDIDYHKANWDQPNYTMPTSIADWPGSLDGYSRQIAPYKDLNEDNVYNPADGDYPLIKGDEAAFMSLNDKGNIHASSNSEPIGITLRILTYTWYSVQPPLSQTIFMDINIHNSGSQTLSNTYFGFWSDFDLGNPADDYVGSLYNKNAYFVYNGDSNDENGMAPGYGTNPPTQAVCFLDNNLDGTRYYNTPGALSEPTNAPGYYNGLTGQWPNGNNFLFGGNAYSSSGTNPYPKRAISPSALAPYVFPGNSDPTGETTGGVRNYGETIDWTEITAATVPGDRKMVGVNGPFDYSPGADKNYSLALVFSRALNGEDPFEKLNEDIDIIKDHYDESTEITQITGKKRSLLQVIPNPANGQEIKITGLTGKAEILNSLGQQVMEINVGVNGNNSIDISSLAAGMFIVRSANGNYCQFVKQ